MTVLLKTQQCFIIVEWEGLSHSTISDFPTYLPAVRKASSPALSSSGCLHSRNVWSKTSLYFSTTFLAEGFTFLSLPCTKSAMMIRKTGPSRIHSIISVPIPPRGCMAKWMEGVGQHSYPITILICAKLHIGLVQSSWVSESDRNFSPVPHHTSGNS